jgi:hypothetical protein
VAQGCESATPAELEIHFEPRPPERDPTLGIPVTLERSGTPLHRLVTIGDSITQGFMSLAVFRTDLSWPAIVARELGIETTFRYPVYEEADGPGGLPLDLERLARAIQSWAGPTLSWSDLPRTLARLRSYMDGIEDFWERGWDDRLPPPGPPFHNLAVYGWDLLDTLALNADRLQRRIDAGRARDQLLRQVVENDNDRAGLVVAARARDGKGRAQTVVEAAAALGAEGTDGPGIETLVVMLGANNALGSVVRLKVCWSTEGYPDGRVDRRLRDKEGFTVWRPSHFAAEWAELVAAIERVRARHVIVATVPAVTIAPVTRGVGTKVRPESRYFPYYTRPWVTDAEFDPRRDPHLTEDDARAIDSAIDAYNATIIASVRAARAQGRDWYLFDLGALLDSLATRRYADPAAAAARPPWWEPYELPPALAALVPEPSTRFFLSGPQGRTDGGLFSLDGAHPTTIGYGIIAQEVIRVMELAGVAFDGPGGQRQRPPPVEVDFERLVQLDTLVSNPPSTVLSTLDLLSWLDQLTDWASLLLPFGR